MHTSVICCWALSISRAMRSSFLRLDVLLAFFSNSCKFREYWCQLVTTTLLQTSQGQFGVKSEIFGEHSSPVLGGPGACPPPGKCLKFWCKMVQSDAFWGHISTSLSSSPAGYTYTRADRYSIGRAANWIYSPTVECVWFTNCCVRAWHDRWMRESRTQCVRLVRSAVASILIQIFSLLKWGT